MIEAGINDLCMTDRFTDEAGQTFEVWNVCGQEQLYRVEEDGSQEFVEVLLVAEAVA